MFSGYKDATSCYTDQSVFDNRNQASFLPGDAAKQTSGPPWDYSQQSYSAVPCYAGDQNMSHRHPTAIHNPQVVSQFENNNVVAHYKSINTGNNSHQSVVRPRAVINCQSSCNACYSHSVARVPHSWNPPPAESIRYISGSSSAALSGDEISRVAPNLASFSQHEDCSHHFSGGFASQLTKLSKFSKDHPASILSTVAPKNDVLSSTEDSNVLRTQHRPSRVEPMPEKYIPPLQSESAPVKKDSCFTCQGVCTRPNCKSYHQQTIKFPNLEPIPIQQYGVPRENVVRFSGQAASTLNSGSSSCNQWHQSPGLWLQNGHPPGFWMPPSEDIHSMGNAGITNFWSDRNSCEISGQQVPLPQNYHDGASNKPTCQGRSQASLHQQKGGGTVHEGERNNRLHQSMVPRYQKVAEVPQRYSEMPLRQKGLEEIAVSQTCQELLPRRSQQLEAVVECGIQYRQDVVSRHQTPVAKSQMETQSRKDDRGHCEPPSTITSELCHQDVTRSHINSSGISSGSALSDFPPTSVEMHTDQMHQDISRKFQAANFASYLPHDTKVSNSSSSDYSAVLGIAQPPSRFSSNLTYTQSKISRSNNYRRLFSQSCPEDSYNPSHSGDIVRNGFVSNRTTMANTLETSGTSHRHISYRNKEISNTGVKCSVQIGSPSANSLPTDSIIRYGNMKDSSEAPTINTTSASVAVPQISPHLQSCGRMSSESDPPYHSGSTTMQVVEINPACSLGSSAGLSVDPKLLNSLSYISSPRNRQDSMVARSQHVPYQNVLAGTRSEGVPACNMFCGSNSSVLHPGLFDEFGKNYSNTHVSGTKASMISRSFKENFHVTPTNIYTQGNMSASASGLKQQMLPQMEDTGASRPIKKRKPRTKSMVKPDCVQLVGKNLHEEHSSQQPVLDVRQFLATWDEETDILSPAPKLPDVLNSSSTENPLLVLDCRHLNTNGTATLSAVDRSSLSNGQQAENFIPMYQQQLASPSESSSTNNDATKSNTQTLQENSNDVMAQQLGECPSLIPIDPDRMEKFGPSNNCRTSSPEHSVLKQNKPSLFQIQETELSTPNVRSESSVSKSDTVESLVETTGTSIINNIQSSPVNVSTESTVSDSVSLHECHTPAQSLPSQLSHFTEDCDSIHENEKTSSIESHHSFVVQDKSRLRGDSCQHVQQKSRSQSKDCDCSSPPQELPLSCCEIHHAIPINTQEKKRADCHHNQEAGNKESRSVACNNKRAVHTLKALCMYVIECSTNAHQTFDRGICSHRKKSVRRSNDGEIQDLEAELCCSLSECKEIEKTCAENGSSVLESTNITDRSCISENNSTKDELTSVSESTRTSCLSDEINDTESKISSNKTSDNKKVLCQQTENISGAQEGMKHALTCGVLVNERAASEANTCTTKISNNLTRTVVTKNTVNIPALTGDMLLETSVTSMDRPVSPNERAEELSKIHLPHSNTEQDLETSVTEKSPAVTDQREIQLSGEDMKSCSVEPVEPSISGRELHDVSVSVTSNSEKSHVNLLSYSSDIGEDLDMSVTSSTPATPVILEEVNEESSTEELVAMYEGSVLSDTESEMRLQPDNCISFSSLPCISKMSIREDAQSDHASRIFESLNGSHTVPGTVDDSFPHLVGENFNPEILSDNKKMARTYGLKMSGKGDTEKCELMSSSEMKSLGSNKEPLPFSENSFVGLHSSGEGAQTQSVKSPACQMLDVNHETAAVIQDDSAASVVPSQTVLNIAIPDSKTSECDVQLHSGPQTKDFTEFVPALYNSTLETSNILCGQEPTTHVSTDISSYADSGTKDDCPLFSEPTANGKRISCTSLLCDTPAIIEVNNRQKENGTSIDDTPSHVPSDTSTLLCEELDLRLAENKMDVLSTKQIQLNANKKSPSVSTFPSFNGGHSPVRSEERKRQQEESSVLNDNSVVLTSSSPDNLISGTSKLAVSGDLEDTLKVNDRFHCSEVSVCGHPDIPFHYSSRQLVTEEIGNDVSEGLPLQGGGTDSERPKLLRNYVAVSKSVSETTVSCPENMTGSVKVVESSHCYGESVEVIQLHQHDPGVKDKLNAVAVCDKNAGCPSVPQDYNGSSGSDVTVRNEYVSKTNENDIKEFVSHKEDDTDWYTQLKPAISHNDNKSVVPHVSESQDIPPVSSFQQQEFCDLHVENKLPIPVDEDKNEENYKMNSGKSNVTAEPRDPSSLFVANAELAPVQNDILMPNSQQTTVLKSSAKLDQKSDELLSEVDHPAVDCELKSPVTKIPWEDTVVADCEALCSHEPINLSKGTSLKWKDDSTIEENFIAGNSRSFEDTRAQSAGHLCRNFCNDISLNEQKNTANRRIADSGYREGDSTPHNDGNIVCKRQDVVRKLPSASDYDVADNAISVSMIVAPVNCDKLDVKNTAISVAVSGDNDEKYDTDACIEGAAVTASATAAAAGEYDGGGDNTCAFTTTDAKESDSARNVDQYPCKVQNNLTCANVIRSVTDPDTVADNIVTITTITAATDTADSSAAATTTINTTNTTTTTTTMTMSTYVTAAPSTTSITDDVSAGNNMNIADAGKISDDTAAVIAATSTIATVIAATTTVANNAATSTTTAATTTTATATATTTTTNDISAGATSCTVITTTFAAVTTANTATSNDYGDISGCDKGSAVTNPLISYGTEEGLQHEASFQCRNTNLVNSMSQEIEWNGMDKEQRYSISMVTSGCLTSEEKNTVKMPVGNDTIENMEYCQPENEVKTTLNLKLEENSKSSTEYIHNQSQKYMTVCETSTSVANVSHVSDHTEYGDTKRQSDNSDTVESMSQQQGGPNQEQISDFEMDTTLAHVQPLQLQCKSAAEPTKDELNNYTRKLCDESSALSVWEDCLCEEEIHNKINNCALVMSHDIHVHQEKHCCLEEPIKNEIFNSDGNIPAETPVHPEWKSADRIIKDEVNCEMNIASDNTSLSEEYHSPLYLNKEEIVDFKINTPENFPSTLSVEQDSSESLGITTVLQVSAGLSPVDEHLSLQEDDDVMSDSVQISLISESSEMIHNNISCLASTRKNVELIQPNMNGQNSPDRQDVDLSVDTDDMPHLEVIDTEVSPHSSDSLEMPCLELVTDPVQPMAIDQVQYAEDMCATAGDLQPVHTLPENMEKNVQEDITEPDMGVVRASQENDTLILEVTVSSLHSVPQSEGNVLPQDQVTNSVNSELTKKLISLVSTVRRSSVSLDRENSTEDSVIQNDSPEEDNVLFASHNSEILQDNQDRYLSVETPVAEECDCSLEKAVECDIQEVPVTPSPLQVLSTYMDSDAPAKVVEVNPEYVQVPESDVPHEWESLHLVTSDIECDQSSEKSQEHTADVTVGEVLALADVEKPWQSCNLENETLISSVGLDVSGTESISSIEAGSMCSAVKETEALISERSENVNLAAAALQDTSDEPTSMVYTEMLPVLDPSLGDVLPVDSVSNWPYLEEEVFSEFPSAAMDSNNSLSVGPSLTVVQSIPNSNCEDTAEFEESLSSDSGSRYNFRTQSCSNDTAVALNGLKCRLSWKKIFALSRADKRNNMKKQESKHGENLEVIYENSKFFAKSKQELKEYTEICHTNGSTELVDKCERLNGNLNTQLQLRNKGITGLELGPAKIEVRLGPTPSPKGHPKTWRVVDDPKAERIVNWRKSNNILLNASAGNSGCRNVVRDVDLLPSEVTQTPIVLVKRLILKRRCDDDSDADSDIKSKHPDIDNSVDPIVSLDNDNFMQVTAPSKHVDESCDPVTSCGKRLEDSEHINCSLEEYDVSNSSLTASNSNTDTQADIMTDDGSSESEEDRSRTSVESSSQKAGRKLKVFKCDDSNAITLPIVSVEDGMNLSPDTSKRSDVCVDVSNLVDVSINSDIGFSELDATNSCLANEDTTKQQLPKVIIKRTVGMGNTNKYQSFLRGVSSSSDSSSRWQPVVRLERNLSLDKLAKSGTVNNRIFEIADVPDILEHGHKSPPDQPPTMLESLPQLAYSSGDRNRNHSMGTRKRKNGTFLCRTDTQQGDLNDGQNSQKYARKLTTFRSSFWFRQDTCSTSLPEHTKQPSNANSYLSQRSPPLKLKFFSSCNKVQKTERKKAFTCDGGDEYVVVENRNYTKDNMTKITFQRHKRKEVSTIKECKNVKMKEFLNVREIPAILDQLNHAEMQAANDVSATCSEDSCNAFNLTACKKRSSTEVDKHSSKRYFHNSHKKHMSDVSHCITSSKQNVSTVLKDAGDVVSEVCSKSEVTLPNDKPSAVSQPRTIQSARTTNDYCPKTNNSKKRRYYEDMYFEKDVLPLFQPERILSISSTKKKRTIVKEQSPQFDGKTLEEEIINLSTESHMDYGEIVPQQQTRETDVEVKEGQNCSSDESLRRLPDLEACPVERMSNKNSGLIVVTSSQEPQPELQTLGDLGPEYVSSSSAMKAGEQQNLRNDNEPDVVESTMQEHDACQACGHVYGSHDERTTHIRRHPYHCQRCHLAFRSEVDFMSHLAEQHPRTRERHHCLLCERSFPTAERYKQHLSGRTHRHLELTQRRTIHTLFSVFTGHNCPVLTPLSESELAGLKWFPVEPGTIHFYHQATPLQRAVQDLLLRKEGNYTNITTKSNVRTQEDHPSKSSDTL